MCHKNCPPAADMKAKTKPVANPCKRSLVDLKLNPSRRSRTKTRRPKFLSLGLQLSPQTSSASAQMNLKPRRSRRIHLRHQQQQRQQQQQLDLFPQRPETTHPIDGDVDKLLDQLRDENDVSLLFDADNTDATTTLNGLLDSTAKASADADTHTAAAASSEEDSVSLIQCAMKSSRRRDHQNPCRQKEKWVCYSEVVEVEQQQESNNSKKEQEEVNSCDADAGCTVGTWQGSTTQMLSLKLDYQHILDAWSDKGKGSLFLRGNDQNEVAAPPSSPSPQTVPQWHNHYNHHLLLGHDCSPVNGVMMTDSWATSASDGSSVWRVPELKVGESERTRDANMECFCLEEKEGSDKMRQREASVLRYKEKRLNRLFYKRIRYEVRKLNAEKRPRIKGRFVRRSGQE